MQMVGDACDGGWPVEWAEAVADENLEIAAYFPAESVIGRRLDGFLLRAVTIGGANQAAAQASLSAPASVP